MNSYLILLYKKQQTKIVYSSKKGLRVFPKVANMLSETSGQHVRSSRNDCPGMQEKLSETVGHKYTNVFIMLKWIEP